jgi:hypothetical protein
LKLDLADTSELDERIHRESDAGSDGNEHEGGERGPGFGPASDPVALSLANAIERASAAGEWKMVAALAAELTAWRERR